MAEKKERKIPEYNEEEFETIKELTSYFNLSPGQVVPPGQEIDEDDYQELAHADAEGDLEDAEEQETNDDLDETLPTEEAPPVLSSIDDQAFDDSLLDLDLDNLTATESTEQPLATATDLPEELATDDLTADLPEELPTDDLTADLPDELPTDDLTADLPEELATDDLTADLPDELATDDLTADLPEELPTDDLTADLPEELATDDLTANLPDELPTDDLTADLPEELPTDDLTANLPDELPTDDLTANLPEELATDDLTADLPDELPTDDLTADELSFEELPTTELTTDELMQQPTFDEDLSTVEIAGDEPLSLEGVAEGLTDEGLQAETEPTIGDIDLDELSDMSLDTSALEASPPETSESTEEQTADSPPNLSDLVPDQVISSASTASSFYGQEDLTDEELKLLYVAIKKFPYAIRKAFIDTILKDRLELADTRELVTAIIDGQSPEKIKTLLEQKLNEELTLDDEMESSRVVFSRESYTSAGLERQAALIKRTKYVAIAAILLLTLSNVGYFFIYKPIRYNQLISWGKDNISQMTPEHFNEAEEYFDAAVSMYPKKTKAYLQYGESYQHVGEYDKAFKKLFGDIELLQTGKAIRYQKQEIRSRDDMWQLLKKVPIVREDNPNNILINEIPFQLHQDGAYTLSHVKNKQDEANVLLALAGFHSNPVNKFHQHPLRNNLLSVDFYQRVLTFDSTIPFGGKTRINNLAISGMGDIYYNQKDYYRSQNYFEKIVRQDPYNAIGQAGILRSLLKIYQETDDPRLIIQRHGEIRNRLKIQDKLPLYMLARLAGFYIDLPNDDDLRIRYNISPIDQVDNTRLKERSIELLDILFGKTEKDIYGNKIEGKSFAEGFYQRGRYYAHNQKQVRMALKQMEYAYLYDPRHFLALSERGEMLMDLNDMQEAMEHFRLAIKQMTPDKLNLLGEQPQDETLLEADMGGIYFNMGKAIYQTAVKNLGDTQSWLRIQESQKYDSTVHSGASGLNEMLDQAEHYFSLAREQGVKNANKRLQLSYYSGWSEYAKGNFQKALQFWESIDSSQQRKYPSLELAKSQALYRLAIVDPQSRAKHLQAALGYLLFLEKQYASQTQVASPSAANKAQVETFSTMAIIQNNLGAIYELMQDQESSLRHYWLAIDSSKKIAQENETANLNIQLNFKRAALEGQERYPVILDFVSPHLN